MTSFRFAEQQIIVPQQQKAMGFSHTIDFDVFWARWGASGKEPGSTVPGFDGFRQEVVGGFDGSDRFAGFRRWFQVSLGSGRFRSFQGSGHRLAQCSWQCCYSKSFFCICENRSFLKKPPCCFWIPPAPMLIFFCVFLFISIIVFICFFVDLVNFLVRPTPGWVSTAAKAVVHRNQWALCSSDA